MLLILPPLVQPNTFYPSTMMLSSYLNAVGHPTTQLDLSIEVLNRLLTPEVLTELFDEGKVAKRLSRNQRAVLANERFYINNVSAVRQFLQGDHPELATLYANVRFWQGMPRIEDEEELSWDYGSSGTMDRAKHLCSLFIKNVCEVVEAIDPQFQLIRYGERICTYLTSLSLLQPELEKPHTTVVKTMLELLDRRLQSEPQELVGLSVPFPGNLLMALHCAKHIKECRPEVRIVMGGGYVNTELRHISEPLLFDYVDYLCFDDGELPLRRIVEGGELIRTITRENGELVRHNMSSRESESIYTIKKLPELTTGLRMERYFNFTDSTNAMHRLWSDGRWNKLMMSHGCYWHKCAFCDTSLDYIGNYYPYDTKRVVDIMERFVDETGCRGFHFVDEAAPPARLRALAEEILRRGLKVTYWTNIRFDSSFTAELCQLLMRSGCIAVSGGVEVASERVLRLMNKGVTLESVRVAMRNLSSCGIMVHAYLMYGFPTQSVGELYESLEVVRDLFADGLLQSAFWHRYAMTCHSPSGKAPGRYNARYMTDKVNPFANNEIAYTEENQPDWDKFSHGLSLATYNYMRGAGFEIPVKKWFK